MCIRDRLCEDGGMRIDLRFEIACPPDTAWGAVHTTAVAACLLYTSDAADERSSVDLGGRRIIKKKNKKEHTEQEQK